MEFYWCVDDSEGGGGLHTWQRSFMDMVIRGELIAFMVDFFCFPMFEYICG